MYIQQLNYWRGPIDACTLYQNIGGVAPMIDAHGYRYKLVFSGRSWRRTWRFIVKHSSEQRLISFSENVS